LFTQRENKDEAAFLGPDAAIGSIKIPIQNGVRCEYQPAKISAHLLMASRLERATSVIAAEYPCLKVFMPQRSTKNLFF
jgi:hypothetical protein